MVIIRVALHYVNKEPPKDKVKKGEDYRRGQKAIKPKPW
jgi:hypothetical protein